MEIKISGFYDEVSSKLDRQIAVVKKLNESYICPRNIDGKNIAEYTAAEFKRKIKPRLDKNGIKFSSIGSPIGKIDIDDDEGFSKQKTQLKELADIARMTGCEYIRIFSFYYGTKKPEECETKVISRLKDFLKIAEDGGVTLLHENEKKIFGDVPERVNKLYEELYDFRLKLCFDASNYVQCGVDPKVAFDALSNKTAYYHIKDCSRFGVEVPLGAGEGRYDYILARLKESGYNGFMTLEPHTFKYAILKPLLYFIPFAPLIAKNHYRAFRLIDEKTNRGYFQCASREDVFIWQYENLKQMLGE